MTRTKLTCVAAVTVSSPSPEAHAAVHGEAGLLVDEITAVTDGASASAAAGSGPRAKGR